MCAGYFYINTHWNSFVSMSPCCSDVQVSSRTLWHHILVWLQRTYNHNQPHTHSYMMLDEWGQGDAGFQTDVKITVCTLFWWQVLVEKSTQPKCEQAQWVCCFQPCAIFNCILKCCDFNMCNMCLLPWCFFSFGLCVIKKSFSWKWRDDRKWGKQHSLNCGHYNAHRQQLQLLAANKTKF